MSLCSCFASTTIYKGRWGAVFPTCGDCYGDYAWAGCGERWGDLKFGRAPQGLPTRNYADKKQIRVRKILIWLPLVPQVYTTGTARAFLRG